MDKLFALSLGFAGLILATHAGHGQPRPDCGPRAQVLEVLAGTYRETRRGIGLAGPQQLVEVFASGTTGSWTITVTLPLREALGAQETERDYQFHNPEHLRSIADQSTEELPHLAAGLRFLAALMETDLSEFV